MGYFSYLPRVAVRTSTFRQNNVEPSVIARNIFRKCTLIEEMQESVLGFQQYSIANNERPDLIASNVYGNSLYDWVVLICNNIINVYDDWPLSEQELQDYVKDKYRFSTGVHHYETNEIKDLDTGKVLVKAGIQVNENWSYIRSDGTTVPNTTYPVSNYEYEKGINDSKSNIWLLRPEYVEDFVDEFENLMKYAPNEELDPESDIKVTPNIIKEVFITNKDTYTTEYGLTPSVEFASAIELVNKTVTTTTTESGATQTTTITSTDVNSSGVVAGTTDASSTASQSSNDTSQSSSSSSSSSSSGSSSSGGGSSSSGGGGYGGY